MANPAFTSTPQPAASAGTPLGVPTVDEGVRLASTGQIAEARACFERILRADPQNSDACNNLGVLHMQTGDPDAAIAMFERALETRPLDRQIRENCIQANFEHGQSLTLQKEHVASIDRYRRTLVLDPNNIGARMNLTNALARTGTPAVLNDFWAEPGGALGHHALIACMPKSGSTLLFEALCALTGWDKGFFAYAYLQNEQELYLPYVREIAKSDTVTQLHCRATHANIHIIQGFAIRPVVLVRNLADIVMSLVDFYDNGAVINSFLGADWVALKPVAKRDYIIDHVMPWYVGFYASWRRAEAESRVDCRFVTYEDMIADKPGTLMAIAEFLGLDKTLDDCRTAIASAEGDKSTTRFNKGVAGRGAAALSGDQQVRLHNLTAPFNSIDFSPIGL